MKRVARIFSLCAALFAFIPVVSEGQPNTLTVKDDNVGIRTDDPTSMLHLFGGATSDVFSGMGVDTNVGPAFNFGYAGGSFGRSAGFFNMRSDALAVAPNPAIYIATDNLTRMIIDNEGFMGLGTSVFGFNPSHPIHHQPSGAHLTTGGVWTNASSIELKQDIAALSAEEALAALIQLEPVRFAYKASGERHVGFIAEEVPELVATEDRRSLSPMDIVAVLTRVAKDQQRQIIELQQRLAEVETSLVAP